MQTIDGAVYRLFLLSRVAPMPAECPVHHLPMLTTHSGLQQVCQIYECEEHVRAEGPYERPIMKEKSEKHVTQTIAPAKVSIPAKADKATRAKAIEEAIQKSKAAKGDDAVAIIEKKLKKKAAPKAKDDGKMSVSDIARSCGVDPKRARARLRAAGLGAIEGRWPMIDKDSKLFKEYCAIIAPPEEEPAEDADDEEADEASEDEE